MNWIIQKLQTAEGLIAAGITFCGTAFAFWKLLWPKAKKGYEVGMAVANIVDILSSIRKEMGEGFTKLEEGMLHNIGIRHAMANAEEDRAFFQADASGKMVWISTAWSRWTGMESHAARGNGWELAVPEEDRARVTVEWQLAIDHQRKYEGRYTIINQYTRMRISVTVTAEPIRAKNGRIMDYLGVIKQVGSPPTSAINLVGASKP